MRRGNIALTIACCLLAVAVSACSGARSLSCPEGTERWVEYRLFMGRGGPDGEIVHDDAWEVFLDEEVTPRFPDGLTVVDGEGQWRGSDGVIKQERSKVLVILAPPGGGAKARLDGISQEYKQRFSQEAVLQTVDEACVAFL